MEKEIVISYKSNIDNLMKVTKYLLLRLPLFKFILLAIILLLVTNNLPGLYKESAQDKNFFIAMLPYSIVALVWVFIIYRLLSSSKENLLKNKKNFELQKITFKKDSYIQEGETFKIENFWNETYQIKETKSWFLIYPKKNSAFPIIKADLIDNQYNELKELFSSIDIQKKFK
ncbi:hypothetical protein [Flavobacterium sp.]|uniref:hypothetical protein n=1 Tax=Flavobacterium sp. TaxID=239 RepID=UPI0026386E6D|nr:hypothetical protein [Flavobacterium sp.]